MARSGCRSRATRSRSRRPLPRVSAAALALLLGACDGQRRASDGSALEEPRTFAAGDQIALSVPADTLSVTLLATGNPADVLSLGVRDDRRVLIDATFPESSINKALRGHGLCAAMLPAATAALPLAASYTVTAGKLGAAGGDPITVQAWVKRRAGGVPAVQDLPLAVLFVGEPPAGFEVALAELGRIWRQGGIEIGEPTRLRVDGPALVTVEVDLGSDSPSVGALLRLSGRAPAGTLSLVVVGDLVLGDTELWALSGGIPVPPVRGTAHSGVLVSAALVRQDPILAGQIIAHEVGHALGLFHTTEAVVEGAERLNQDGLEDTPECPFGVDRDRDNQVSARECEGHGADNLMFWATARGATRLTAAQGEIARRSALVR